MPLFIVEFLYWSAHFELSVILELSSVQVNDMLKQILCMFHTVFQCVELHFVSFSLLLVFLSLSTLVQHFTVTSICFLFVFYFHPYDSTVGEQASTIVREMEALSMKGCRSWESCCPFFYDPRISRYLQMSLKTAVTRGSFFFYELFGRLRICRVSFEQRFCNLELDVVLLMLFSRLFSRLFFIFLFRYCILTVVCEFKTERRLLCL